MIIADHTGGMMAASNVDEQYKDHSTKQPGFAELVSLARESRVIVKISALYRSSADSSTNFADMEPIIRELATQAPASLIWASDWPHTGDGKNRTQKDVDAIEPFRKINTAGVLRNLRSWMNEDAWMKMMVQNPQALFE